MRTNLTKRKLADGQVVFGGLIGSNAPDQVELFGAIGYDFVFLDCEHGSISLAEVENMCRAAEVYEITPIVRVPNHAETTILQYLDRGVQGIIVPHVNTRADAEAVARAARYFPDGNRGVGSGRAHDYGVRLTREESTRWINAETLVIPMVEEVEAIDNLDDILSVPGVDILHVASSDLTQSLGYPGPEKVREVMRDTIRRIRAGGKAAGAGGNSPTDTAGVAEMIDAGANFITISALGLMRLGAESFRRAVLDQRSALRS